MTNINNLEEMANKNSDIAKQEKDVALLEKKIANEEFNRTKARERLAENEENLAKITLILKEKSLK